MKTFFKHLLFISVCITAITALLALTKSTWFLPIFFGIIVYFTTITYLTYRCIHKVFEKNAKRFPQVFMLTTFCKLFLHIIVLAGYMFTHLLEAKRFLVFFAVVYLIYTVFETISLVKLVRSSTKKKN